MSEWSPEDRALLDRARGGHDPTDADRARVRAAVVATVGLATGLTVGTTTGSAVAASGLVKALVVVGLVGAVGGGVVALDAATRPKAPAAARIVSSPRPVAVVAARSLGPAAAGPRATGEGASSSAPIGASMASGEGQAGIAATRGSMAIGQGRPGIAPGEGPPGEVAPSGPPRGLTASGERVPERAAAQEAATLGTPGEPGPILAERGERRAADRVGASSGFPVAGAVVSSGAASPNGVSALADDPPSALHDDARSALHDDAPSMSHEDVTPTAPTARVEAEARLVSAALAALHAGDPERALALFDEHAREYPDGVLGEESDAERVEALCDLGRANDARAAADAFLRGHPGSRLAGRVRRACAPSSRP